MVNLSNCIGNGGVHSSGFFAVENRSLNGNCGLNCRSVGGTEEQYRSEHGSKEIIQVLLFLSVLVLDESVTF